MKQLYTIAEIADAHAVSLQFLKKEVKNGHLTRLSNGLVRSTELNHWQHIRARAIDIASEFITSDDARLLNQELFEIAPEVDERIMRLASLAEEMYLRHELAGTLATASPVLRPTLNGAISQLRSAALRATDLRVRNAYLAELGGIAAMRLLLD